MHTFPIDRSKRIAIIGAGPAGLSTALFLQKHGYSNVTILEKLGRAGGLCKSLTIDGMSYDLGANYVTWAYTETLKIAKEFKATTYVEKPYVTIQLLPDNKITYRPVLTAILYNPYSGKTFSTWTLVLTAIRYFFKRWKLSPLVDPPNAFARVDEHPELCVTFKEWLDTNNVTDLASLFEIPITMMGYDQLSEIAAPYALKYMSLKTFVPMLLTHIPVINLLFQWPRRFTFGFQRLWESVSWRLNVRLNVRIKSIDRSNPDEPITIKFDVAEQDLDQIQYVEDEMQFDYLVLACPLRKDVFEKLNLNENAFEQEITDHIKISEYCMTTFWVDGLKQPDPIAPVLPIPQGGIPWAVARQYQDQGNFFTQFYTQSDATQSRESVIQQVRLFIERMGGTINETQERWHTFDRFTYFQHVGTSEFKSGFYKRIAENQGEDRTFYVGGLTDFELVEPIVQHSKFIVEKHFVGSKG